MCRNNTVNRDNRKNCANILRKEVDIMSDVKMELYHGSGDIVEFPEIRKTRYTKDFSWGFYCTQSYEQAHRWAERRHTHGVVNVYIYHENPDEWLDFIAECRSGKIHDYDIVEGPMADDTIWNFVNDFLNGNISRSVFWEYAKFKHPTHQISFHSIKALACLEFERSEEIHEQEL